MGFARVCGAWGGLACCRPLNQPSPNPVPAWVQAGKAETSALSRPCAAGGAPVGGGECHGSG